MAPWRALATHYALLFQPTCDDDEAELPGLGRRTLGHTRRRPPVRTSHSLMADRRFRFGTRLRVGQEVGEGTGGLTALAYVACRLQST
jgi:hypothetical protein